MKTDIDHIASAISSLTELCNGMLSRIEKLEQQKSVSVKKTDPEIQVTDPILVGTNEASHLLNLSPRKLRDLTSDGTIPCVRLGRRVLYSVEALRLFVSNRSGISGGSNG